MNVQAIIDELRNRGGNMLSLDTPQEQDGWDLAADIGIGFTPGLGTAQAMRDFERARRDDDGWGMALSGLGMLPFAGGIIKGAKTIGKSSKAKTVNDAVGLPPPENASRTQISGTTPTYKKAANQLADVDGDIIDFGAGLGQGAQAMGDQLGRKIHTYEPYATNWKPDFSAADASDVPSDAYGGLTNLNVLNVVPREARDGIVQNISRVLRDGGKGVITTRGKDVMNASGRAGPEPMSVITSRDTYQKGFTNPELQEYLKYMLGDKFDVNRLNLGPAGAVIEKKPGMSVMVPENYNPSISNALRQGKPSAAPIYDINGVPIEARTKTNQTRYENALKQSRPFQRMEKARNGDTIITDTHQFSETPIIKYEEMLGKRGVPINGDRIMTGKRLDRLNGIDLEDGVDLGGGPLYPHYMKDNGKDYAWASMGGTATAKNNHFKAAAQDFDGDVLGIYNTMGMDGLNFTAPTAEIMVKALREMGMNKADINAINKQVRQKQGANDFIGLESPEVLDQLMGRNAFPMEGSGALRKAMVEVMSKAEHQQKGAPNYFDIMNAITEPELMHDVPHGMSGFSVVRGMPNADVIRKADIPEHLRHPSYDSVIPGNYMGRMEQMIPQEVMFPKMFERMRQAGKTGLHRSFSSSNTDFETFDEQWLDGVLKYLRNGSP